ncbi:DEAD/DEAH box helicase [Polaribacter pacificus]|uniref:DEAD-box ATP-dependent RNA helicase RhpA n=1 Tax=Polaribacter pacificus TaxID=1775173 RepID=A0A917HXH7_9FLAO|nr:DEAD/DEAH box helicase [Polaribacter pacificus]GGG96663.1 DEAD/DEAH box helicase [Polaribacter pacificus]
MQFKELALNKPILKAIIEKGYETPTLVQQQAIPLILERKDLIASAQTGTGKTAAFALPILQQLYSKQDASKKGKKIRALVVSPTRELALQIEENFKSYSRYTNLRTTVIFGGTSFEPQKEQLRKGVDILIATPGRLLDLHKQDYINLDYIETLVLDEADLMLDMGFIDDVKKIERLCPETKQTLLFSATFPFKVEALAKTILKDPEKVEVSPTSSTVKAVQQWLYYVPKPQKIELCLHLLRNTIKGTVIIFRRTKYGVDKLEKTLLRNGYKADSIHGDKAQTLRQEALQKFKNKEINILIATDVAARGIDVKNVDAVINFDLPNISETYVHRIGRTGRAGETGIAYSFCSADEKDYIASIQKLINKELDVEDDHPYPLDPKAKPEVHTSNGSKYRKGRKSEASKKKKKRWY